jgi:transposase
LNLSPIFSLENTRPAFFRMVYGTIRDAKIIPAAVMEASISYAIVVVDKGFYSEKNKKILES